ncbi:DUF2339 domain-containing protein, partial [Patulibacter sp.]|uniref:DUF2339 domain-containing protein n=1 Tax=Patulibacter sp. TaxID=1912859 RepID=UPI0027238BD1
MPRVPPSPAPAVRALVDEALVGGRLLAWAGGAALLVALGTLFWLGVRDGVITEAWRCVIGMVASFGLLAAGLRNARRGVAREASWAMAGTGLGGLYATAAVATATYGLLPEVLGLGVLAGLGITSAALALRWDAPPLAGVGLLGALGAPVIAPVDGLVLPIVVVAMAATGLLLRRRPWTWLAAAATVLALPQVAWGVFSLLDDLDGPTGLPGVGLAGPDLWTVAAPGVATVAALAAGLVIVAGWEIRAPRDRQRWSMPLLLVPHAGLAAALGGGYALIGRPVEAVLTLVASAALLAAAALVVRRRAGRTGAVDLALLSIAVLVLDLGFAIGASGTWQLVGWAVAALAFAVLARHAAKHHLPVLIGGLGLHAGLALVEAVGTSGGPDEGFLVACAVLAAVCGVSARVVAPRSEDARVLLDVAALGVLFWWTSATLPADRLALVLAGEAGALLLLDRRRRDVVTRGAALTSLAVAAAVALLHDDGAALRASWGVVGDGTVWILVLPLLAVAGAACVGITTLRDAMTMHVRRPDGDGAADELPVDEPVRGALAGVAGATALLGASILAGHLTATLGGGADAVAVVRDGLWASTGLALLAAGLHRREAPVRMVGLLLLAGVGGKIALLDLADVDTAGRVVAWAVLGVLLLVGAGLYGRLRPEDDGQRGDGYRAAGPRGGGPR